MLFNSLEFVVFLPLVFLGYWFIFKNNLKLQNAFVVFASYVFYGWWDWRFLGLILFSTLVDYGIGLGLNKAQEEKKRKLLLGISLSVNLGLLGFFKYYNFFLDSFISAFTFFGTPFKAEHLQIVLPVGISFYTFQTLSYSIDVYRKKLEPTKDFVAFAAFVSFFPQLVAGPIERASHLLPQFYQKRTFNYAFAVDGMRQILWGLFKKVVIADNCAQFANEAFLNYQDASASTLVLGAIFFAFQIYGDFSGYSDIAIGTSRLFGFDLMQNFNFPYFSRDMGEFWRRWHISLNTWFRDYLYIPLGGSRGSKAIVIRNTFIIFIVSGFWHGANWTFIVWGLLNALYFLPLLLRKKNRKNIDVVAENKRFPSFKEFAQMLATFGLTVLAWIFFRAENMQQALIYIKRIFSKSIIEHIQFSSDSRATSTLMLIGVFLLIEWNGRYGKYALEKIGLHWKKSFRWTFYFFIIFLMGMFMATDETPFIYFQF